MRLGIIRMMTPPSYRLLNQVCPKSIGVDLEDIFNAELPMNTKNIVKLCKFLSWEKMAFELS